MLRVLLKFPLKKSFKWRKLYKKLSKLKDLLTRLFKSKRSYRNLSK